MFHRPVCVPCQTEFRPSNNNCVVLCHSNLNPATDPTPFRLWAADEYECPKCHHKIVVGFAQQPYAEHYQPEFQRQLEAVPTKDLVKCTF